MASGELGFRGSLRARVVYTASMFNARTLAARVAIASSLAAVGCKPDAPSTTPESSDSTSVTDGVQSPAATAEPKAPVVDHEQVLISASLRGLDDMMEVFRQVSLAYNSEDPIDPSAQLQAMLLSQGFAPSFYGNLLLDREQKLEVRAGPDSEPEDIHLAAAVAVADPVAAIEGMPSSFRPQSTGENSWLLEIDSFDLLMKHVPLEVAGAEGKPMSWDLRMGFGSYGLSRADALRAEGESSGPRVHVVFDDINTQALGLAGMFDDGTEFGERVQAFADGLTQVSLGLDWGTDRDAMGQLGVHAPIEALGAMPWGPARQTATSLESHLPGGAVMVNAMSWGDPKLLHRAIDEAVPVDEVPPPFAELIRQTTTALHGMLYQISNDVVSALYIDQANRSALVFAAEVEDDAVAWGHMRTLEASLVTALEAHATLQGDHHEKKYKATFQPSRARLPGVKADTFKIRLSSKAREDAHEPILQFFLTKDTIEYVSFVHQNVAVVAIGPGATSIAKATATSIANPGSGSLAEDEGLALARAKLGGCQLCSSLDVVEYLRTRLLLLAQKAKLEKDVQALKRTVAPLVKVKRLETLPEVGIGLHLDANQATLEWVVPKALMFADAATLKQIGELVRFVHEPTLAQP